MSLEAAKIQKKTTIHGKVNFLYFVKRPTDSSVIWINEEWKNLLSLQKLFSNRYFNVQEEYLCIYLLFDCGGESFCAEFFGSN